MIYTFLNGLAWALAWCKAHPAETTMAVGAVVSTGAKYLAPALEARPRLKAFCDLLAHAGVNLPGVANAVSRFLTGAKVAAASTAAGAVLLLSVALGGCGGLTAQDKGDLAAYEAEQGACVAATPDNKAQIDACRAAVKAKWCAQWKARFDAGVCQ